MLALVERLGRRTATSERPGYRTPLAGRPQAARPAVQVPGQQVRCRERTLAALQNGARLGLQAAPCDPGPQVSDRGPAHLVDDLKKLADEIDPPPGPDAAFQKLMAEYDGVVLRLAETRSAGSSPSTPRRSFGTQPRSGSRSAGGWRRAIRPSGRWKSGTRSGPRATGSGVSLTVRPNRLRRKAEQATPSEGGRARRPSTRGFVRRNRRSNSARSPWAGSSATCGRWPACGRRRRGSDGRRGRPRGAQPVRSVPAAGPGVRPARRPPPAGFCLCAPPPLSWCETATRRPARLAMSISVRCEECDKTYQVSDKAGRRGKCPEGHSVHRPGPGRRPPPRSRRTPSPSRPRPPTPRPAAAARPRHRSRTSPDLVGRWTAISPSRPRWPGSRDGGPAPKTGRHRPEGRPRQGRQAEPDAAVPRGHPGPARDRRRGRPAGRLAGRGRPAPGQADAANKKAAAAEERAQKAEAFKLAAEADLDKLKKSPPRDPAFAETQAAQGGREASVRRREATKARRAARRRRRRRGRRPRPVRPRRQGGPGHAGRQAGGRPPGQGQGAGQEGDGQAGPGRAERGDARKELDGPGDTQLRPAQLQSRRPAGYRRRRMRS